MSDLLRTRASLLFFVPFAITFLDSAFAYFAHPLGYTLTANAAVPFVLLYFCLFDWRSISLPRNVTAWLIVLTLSLCLAIVTARNMDLHRLLEVGSCIASFAAGYVLWRRVADANQLAWWLVALSLVYVIICLIALAGIDPGHFPIKVHYWSQEGFAQARPMVTADSNMQFYYVFPAALALALPFRLLRTAIAAPVAVAGLYILAQLQTRSGVLSFCGVIALALAAPLWAKQLGRKKILLYLLAGAIGLIVFWPVVRHAAELVLYRLTEGDMASANGRIDSTLYGLHHLLDPYWWIPRGADEFLRRYGGLPHSNLTAIFLDGGLPGLIAWIALVIAPIAQGARLFFRGQLDAAAVMALIAAIAVLMVQLSLHNPMRDQIWLWAGVLVGALTRIRAGETQTAPQPALDASASAFRIDAAGIINSPYASPRSTTPR